MAQIIREITIDVAQANNLRAITAKQNDLNSRFLKVYITNEGTPVMVDPHAQVIMNVKRTDNAVKMFYGSVNDDASVTVPLTPWMLELEGSINCDISIVSTDDLQKLTSMQFSIYVEAAVYPQEVLEEDENYDVLVKLLDAAEHAEECAEATEEAKEAADLAKEAASGVVTVEQHRQTPLKFWVGTKAEYDALAEHEPGCFYIISDDTDLAELTGLIAALSNKVDNYHTPYDISNAVIPGKDTDSYTLIKYGKILMLTYNSTATGNIGNSTVCTIEGYTPVCDITYQVMHSGTEHHRQLKLCTDETGINTIVSSLGSYVGAGTLGYFVMMFICK